MPLLTQFSTTLESLGHDILIDNVFPYLDEQDILNLRSTSRSLSYYTSDPSVWHDLYFKTFGLQPNPFTTYKWPEMYRWRSKAGIFTWGDSTNGRLGYNFLDVPKEDRSSGMTRGICRPHAVPQLANSMVVSDVAGSGFSFSILTAQGKIFAIGELHAYPPSSISSLRGQQRARPNLALPPRGPIFRGPFPHVPRIGQPFLGNAEIPQITRPEAHLGEQAEKTTEPSDDIDYVSSFSLAERAKATQLKVLSEKDVKFTSISCGRCHLIALDENNDIWVWDQMYRAAGTRLSFPFNKEKNKVVRKISAGWNYSSALVDGVGLVVWFNHGSLQQIIPTESELAKAKSEGRSVNVDYAVVPFSNNSADSDDYIVDFMAGDAFLLYLTRDGRLYRVETSDGAAIISEPRTKLDLFTEELAKLTKGTGQFVKISGSFLNFAVLSDTEHVLIGSRDSTDPKNQHRPVVIPELQQVGCISVTTGDHHFLAVLRGGKLLSWGRESRGCGSFGLGPPDSLESKGAKKEEVDYILTTPVEVDTKGGHVLAVAAGGWHSCAIITTEEIV